VECGGRWRGVRPWHRARGEGGTGPGAVVPGGRRVHGAPGRERDAKLAGGPPGEWGPAVEGEKKGREGDQWDWLGVGPTGRERRERALTGGPLGLNKFDLFQTNSIHSNLI
jgi:hypothetical protein